MVARIVEEMKAHRDVFVGLERGAHELSSFWLRKTRKPVLAVLCVRKRDAGGTVSTPTRMAIWTPPPWTRRSSFIVV